MQRYRAFLERPPRWTTQSRWMVIGGLFVLVIVTLSMLAGASRLVGAMLICNGLAFLCWGLAERIPAQHARWIVGLRGLGAVVFNVMGVLAFIGLVLTIRALLTA